MSKLSNIVDKDVAKKTIYKEIVKKVNTIDSDKHNLENQISDVDKKIRDTT